MPQAQLQGLPNELLLAIALHVPQPALSGLSHTCRNLNQVVTPLLYESVVWQANRDSRYVLNDEALFWQQEDPPTERSVTRQADASVIPSSGSRIFDLDAFTRTVLSSESLRSFVKNVDLRWQNEHFDDDDSVRCCLQALESSHLRMLHLSPADFSFEIPARPAVTSLAYQIDRKWAYSPQSSHLPMLHLSPAESSFEIPAQPAVTSLAYQIDSPQSYAVDLDRLHTLFCIPSLIRFRLDGWPFWAPLSCKGRAWAKSEGVGPSNVEDLTLSSGEVPGDEVREVLSWPKALKRFTFVPHHNPHYKDSITLRSQLQYVLQDQRLTLEYLHAGVPNCSSGKEK